MSCSEHVEEQRVVGRRGSGEVESFAASSPVCN